MQILPAIDLKDGKAVRLSKGLMKSAKIYSNEPWQVARRFEELGSKWVHIVDLKGAFSGFNLTMAERVTKEGQVVKVLDLNGQTIKQFDEGLIVAFGAGDITYQIRGLKK